MKTGMINSPATSLEVGTMKDNLEDIHQWLHSTIQQDLPPPTIEDQAELNTTVKVMHPPMYIDEEETYHKRKTHLMEEITTDQAGHTEDNSPRGTVTPQVMTMVMEVEMMMEMEVYMEGQILKTSTAMDAHYLAKCPST